MAVHFSGGAPKGASPKNYGITVFNQSKEIREGGLQRIKGEQALIESKAKVWSDFLEDIRETEIVEANARNLSNEIDTQNRQRIFDAEERNREIEIRNLKIKNQNKIQALDSLGKFVGHGVQIGATIQKKLHDEKLADQNRRYLASGLDGFENKEILQASAQYVNNRFSKDVARDDATDKIFQPLLDAFNGNVELMER